MRKIVSAAFGLLAMASPLLADEQLDFADGLYARKMYAPAAAEYEKFIAANPASPETASARFRLADSTFFTKDHRKAIGLFESFVSDFPKDERVPRAVFRIGLSKLELNDLPTASRIFSELSSQVPDRRLRAGCLFYQARIHDAKQEPEKSLEVLKELFRVFPETEYAAYAGITLGERYIKEGRFREAFQAYQAVSEKAAPAAAVKEARLGLAGLHFRQKEYDKARGLYQEVFDSSGASPRFRERAALGLIEYDLSAHDLESARKRLEELDRTLSDPKTPAWVADAALFLKARLLKGSGQSEPALAELGKLIDKNSPRAGQAHLEKAGILRGLGRKSEAVAAYEAVAENSGYAYRTALFEKGTLYLELDDAPKAREAFQKYLDRTPALAEFKKKADDETLYELGFAAANVYRFKEAAEAFQAILDGHPGSALIVEAVYGTATNFENAGLLKEAVPFYEKLVRTYPDHALSRETLSRLGSLYVRLGDLHKAAAFYEEILIEGKKDVPVTPDAAFWLVQYFLDNGKFENAQKALAGLPARFPGTDYSHEIAYFSGEAFLGLQDTVKAEASFSEALSAKPQGPYAPHALLGLGLARGAAGDAPGAEAKFNEALRFDDEPEVAARARFEIANLRFRAGDLAEAAKAYMLVAVLFDHPQYSAEALYQAGQCFAKTGHAEDSQKAFMELKTRYPKSEWAGKA